MRRLLSLFVCCIAAAALPTAADAATRLASPSGITSGDCTAFACALNYAANQAQTGDTLSLESGTYTLVTALELTAAQLTVRGDEQSVVAWAGAVTTSPLVLGADTISVSDVTVVGTTSVPLIIADAGVAHSRLERVVVRQTGTGPALWAPQTTVVSSLFVSTGSAAATVVMSGQLLASTVQAASGYAVVNDGNLAVSGTPGALTIIDTLILGSFDVRAGVTGDLQLIARDGDSALGAITVDYSALRRAAIDTGGGIISLGEHLSTSRPALDANGCVSSQATTINAGDPNLQLGAEARALNGLPRSIGAAGDIGACEQPLRPDAALPDVAPIAASELTITGVVNPNGARTSVALAYRVSGADGWTIRRTTPLDIGNAEQTVAFALTKLERGVTYDLELRATNTQGTTSVAGTLVIGARAPMPRVRWRVLPSTRSVMAFIARTPGMTYAIRAAHPGEKTRSGRCFIRPKSKAVCTIRGGKGRWTFNVVAIAANDESTPAARKVLYR